MSKVLAEIQVIPQKLGAETAEIYALVDHAIAAIQASGVRYEVGALGTTVEGEYEQVVSALLAAHRAVLDAGADAAQTNIRLLERRDGDVIMDDKITKYR